jgi:hypothetical protein
MSNDNKNGSQPKETLNVSELEPVALTLFGAMLSSNTGYETEAVAAKAFAAAKVFCDEAKRLKSGGKVFAEPKNRKITIWIHSWDPVTEQPMYNDAGEPVWMESQGDPYSYAPNKSVDHPVNQSFYLSRHELGLDVPDKYRQALRSALTSREGRVFVTR